MVRMYAVEPGVPDKRYSESNKYLLEDKKKYTYILQLLLWLVRGACRGAKGEKVSLCLNRK